MLAKKKDAIQENFRCTSFEGWWAEDFNGSCRITKLPYYEKYKDNFKLLRSVHECFGKDLGGLAEFLTKRESKHGNYSISDYLKLTINAMESCKHIIPNEDNSMSYEEKKTFTQLVFDPIREHSRRRVEDNQKVFTIKWRVFVTTC